MANTRTEQIENILGKPVATQFVDDALKVRRNLLLTSFAVLGIVWGNITVTSTVTIMGLQLGGITTFKLDIGLLVVTGYLLIHFGWYFYDSFFEWRLRLTGTRSIVPNTWTDEAQDITPDARQSTLYNWWRNRSSSFKELEDASRDLIAAAATLNGLLGERYESRDHEVQEIIQRLNQIQGPMNQAMATVQRWESGAPIERMTISLGRFDAWYRHFRTSQSWRWLVIDAGMPLALGLFAFGSLFHRVWPSLEACFQ